MKYIKFKFKFKILAFFPAFFFITSEVSTSRVQQFLVSFRHLSGYKFYNSVHPGCPNETSFTDIISIQ